METTLPSRLEDHIGYWLRLVSNHVSGGFATRLKSKDISVAEWVVLRMLHDGAAAPSLVASRLGMTRGAVTKIVARLADRHLVEQRASAEDGRGQWLALTGRGRKLVPVLAALADANDTAFFSVLAPKARADLLDLLKRLAAGNGIERAIPTA